MIRAVILITLTHLTLTCHAQSPQVTDLLRRAELKKDTKDYAPLLHKADSLAAGDIATQALVNKKLGTYYYSKDPDKSIHHFRQAVSYYSILDNKPEKALGLQNIAFVHDEEKLGIAAAIPYAEQALDIWTGLNDTLQMANMHKYLGLLQGKVSRGDAAKLNISRAIELYRSKNNEAGIAVSWHNIAVVNRYQRQYDTALAFIDRARTYWQGKDSSRIFGLNNLAFEIHLAVNNLTAADSTYRENLALYNDKFSWRDRLTFYAYSINYLRTRGREQEAAQILNKYQALHESLKKKGIIRPES